MVTIFLVYNYMHRVLTENTPVSAANITHSITIFINSLIPPPNCLKYSVIHTQKFEYIILILQYAASLITLWTHSYTQTSSLSYVWYEFLEIGVTWRIVSGFWVLPGSLRNVSHFETKTSSNRGFVARGNPPQLCCNRNLSRKTKGAFTLASFGPL